MLIFRPITTITSNLSKLGAKCFSSTPPKLATETYTSSLPDTFYNEEQLEMQKSFRKIIENDINPYIDDWENKEQWAPLKEIFGKLGKAGLLGVNKPVEYGGLGLDYKYQAAILEEAGTMKCAAIPMAFAVSCEMAVPALTRFGTDELKKEFLTPVIRGEKVVCLGVSEPGAGSDVSGIKTTAVKKGGDWVINGQKMWITNSFQADYMCLLANTSAGAPHKNKSLLIVPMDLKGISKTKINKIGMNSSDTGHIFLEDVRVPEKYLIGTEGDGFTYQMLQFQDERLAAVIIGLRPLDMAISQTIDYTRQRQAFGQSILDNQVVHFRLAELATEVECLRALTYKAIDLATDGHNVTKLASMVKLKAGRLTREVADSCLQYWGGMGYSRETSISRMFRDGRLLSIGGGSDETMLSIIAKLMGTLPRAPTTTKSK